MCRDSFGLLRYTKCNELVALTEQGVILHLIIIIIIHSDITFAQNIFLVLQALPVSAVVFLVVSLQFGLSLNVKDKCLCIW